MEFYFGIECQTLISLVTALFNFKTFSFVVKSYFKWLLIKVISIEEQMCGDRTLKQGYNNL